MAVSNTTNTNAALALTLYILNTPFQMLYPAEMKELCRGTPLVAPPWAFWSAQN
jgi:hypothetical protein